MFAGAGTQGLVEQTTVTLKLRLALPLQLVATQSTVVVVPGVKLLPEGGEHTAVRLVLHPSIAVTV
jgi:hypothetical protein